MEDQTVQFVALVITALFTLVPGALIVMAIILRYPRSK